MNTPYRKETYREYEKERLQAVVNNRLQIPKWSAVKVCLACLAVATVVSMAVICVVRDKKNEQRDAKIFKHQVLAYLPENAEKNFPSPRGRLLQNGDIDNGIPADYPSPRGFDYELNHI